MKEIILCQNCFSENLNIDGMLLTCFDCGYEWESYNIESMMEIPPEEAEFRRLIQLKQPYFALKHGKIYECTVDYGEKFKKRFLETTIIPLASKENSNLFYVLSDARHLLNINKQFVKEIISKDFQYLYYGGVKDDYPFDFGVLTTECTTDEEGNIMDDGGAIYYGFVETDELV